MTRSAVASVVGDEGDDFQERGSREENAIDTFVQHLLRVFLRDRSTSTTEYTDVSRALRAEKLDDFGEEFNMPAVVAADADGADIFLDRGADNRARGAVITQVNHFHAVADQLEIHRVDRAVVPVADRDGGEDSQRAHHLSNSRGCHPRSSAVLFIST